MAVNVGRGLFRAWIVVTVVWTIGSSLLTYEIMGRDLIRGSFQPMAAYKKPGPYTDAEVFGPFYGLVRSPSAERLTLTFRPVEYEDRTKWENDPKMLIVKMPDESRVFMAVEYNRADRDYIAMQFWDQRWWRRGELAKHAALWSIAPMLALFVVVYSLLWVGRGFKSR